MQYNSALFVSGPDVNGVNRLYESKDDQESKECPIARIPKDCIIEFASPCRTYNAVREESELQLKQQIESLQKEVRSLIRKIGKTK